MATSEREDVVIEPEAGSCECDEWGPLDGRRRRRYPPEVVAQTLELLAQLDGNLTACSQATGIPASTVFRWREGERLRRRQAQAHVSHAEQLAEAPGSSLEGKGVLSLRLSGHQLSVILNGPDWDVIVDGRPCRPEPGPVAPDAASQADAATDLDSPCTPDSTAAAAASVDGS